MSYAGYVPHLPHQAAGDTTVGLIAALVVMVIVLGGFAVLGLIQMKQLKTSRKQLSPETHSDRKAA